MSTITDDALGLNGQSALWLSQYYRATFAWVTTVDSATGDLRLQVGTLVDAVIIRAGFAAEVNSILTMSLLRAPIILAPGRPSDWIFLTEGRTPLRRSTMDDLVRIQVGWKPQGAVISLPVLEGGRSDLRWLERPAPGTPLPPWTAVIGAARHASSLCGGW